MILHVKIAIVKVAKYKQMYCRYILLVNRSNRSTINQLSLDSKGELINKYDKLEDLVNKLEDLVKSLFDTGFRIS